MRQYTRETLAAIEKVQAEIDGAYRKLVDYREEIPLIYCACYNLESAMADLEDFIAVHTEEE